MIQSQVKLPLSVAFGVVIQGIRIRLGRSIITLLGVVLGIAFFISNVTGQAVKQAVQQEDLMRTEVKRMASFLEAEMGPPLNRVIGVIQTGPLNEQETRLLRLLIDGKPQAIQWHAVSSAFPAARFEGVKHVETALESVAGNASSVLIVGPGAVPAQMNDPANISAAFAHAAEKVLAYTREDVRLPEADGVSVVGLARQMTPDETARRADEKRQTQFRTIWITVISLLVTVVGIANAMLMSVTERFREIGTMKCLGALSSFIRWIFFFESSLMGAVGGAAGGVLGILFSIAVYGFTYGYDAVLSSVDFLHLALLLVLAILVGVALSVMAAIYPAGVASRMVPANALRTNV